MCFAVVSSWGCVQDYVVGGAGRDVVEVFLTVLTTVFAILCVNPIVAAKRVGVNVLANFTLTYTTLVCTTFFSGVGTILYGVATGGTNGVVANTVSTILTYYVVTSNTTFNYILCKDAGDRTRSGATVILNYGMGKRDPNPFLHDEVGTTCSCLDGGPRTITILDKKRKGNRGVSRTRYVFEDLARGNVSPDQLFVRSGSAGARRGFGCSLGVLRRGKVASGGVAIVAGSFRRCETNGFTRGYNLVPRSCPDGAP